MAPRKPARPSRAHRSTLSLQKTEVIINAYDLLPVSPRRCKLPISHAPNHPIIQPGKLASTLWFLGTSLLHSGVVINDREYAYGGHDRPGLTGVYWTRPRTDPPGGTFRCEILHGFTLASDAEIETTIKEVSEEFQGTAYNLLTRNCNHFTAYLCERLTGRAGPSWLNRAASIGVAMPCIVPRAWVEPPDFETADGELLDEDDMADEQSRMLRSSSENPRLVGRPLPESAPSAVELAEWDGDGAQPNEDRGRGKAVAAAIQDTAGRTLPAAERAPMGGH
jgi:hypothetical protein